MVAYEIVTTKPEQLDKGIRDQIVWLVSDILISSVHQAHTNQSV